MTAHIASVKPYKGLGMEGAIAKWYASLARKGMDEFQALARRVAGQMAPGGRVLDVACGPGYFAVEMARLGGYSVTGLDISESFVKLARANAERANVDVDFQHGNASDMPFGGGMFDFVLCRAAFKNFSDPLGALREMCRVLKPRGRALIIDLRRDASPESVSHAVDGMRLGAVNSVLTKLTFRFVLLKRAYTKPEFENLALQTGFGSLKIQESLTGLEVRLRRS